MNTEVWALTGVVVGSVLGGGAQILADTLRGRRDRQHYVRDARRAAYAELLAAETDACHRMELALRLKDTPIKSSEDGDLVRRLVLESRQASARFDTAVASVGLVGPTDTWDAAVRLRRTAGASATDAENGDLVRKLNVARQMFLDLAHRDLGVPGVIPVKVEREPATGP